MSEHHRWSPGRLSVSDLTTTLHTPSELDAYTAAIDARDAAREQQRQYAIVVFRWLIAACVAAISTGIVVRWLTAWHPAAVGGLGLVAAVGVLALMVVAVDHPQDLDSPAAAGSDVPAAGEPATTTTSTEEFA